MYCLKSVPWFYKLFSFTLENILLTKKSRTALLKIVDFGLSKDMNTRLASFVGKLQFNLSLDLKMLPFDNHFFFLF